MSYTYRSAIDDMINSCRTYIDGMISPEEFQKKIQETEKYIVAIEESDLRNYLIDVDGNIELILFTVDSDKINNKIKKIAQDVLIKFMQY